MSLSKENILLVADIIAEAVAGYEVAITQLRDALDALRSLYDEQNGPPMLAPRHRKAWLEAMRRAGEILKKHGV